MGGYPRRHKPSRIISRRWRARRDRHSRHVRHGPEYARTKGPAGWLIIASGRWSRGGTAMPLLLSVCCPVVCPGVERFERNHESTPLLREAIATIVMTHDSEAAKLLETRVQRARVSFAYLLKRAER
jgi:hypothetical protein